MLSQEDAVEKALKAILVRHQIEFPLNQPNLDEERDTDL
jgi:hypothetical protein